MNRRRFAAYLTAAVAGLSARMGLARPDEGHTCLINGVRFPWPDDGLTIEVRPTADGRPYGPFTLFARKIEGKTVTIQGQGDGAVSLCTEGEYRPGDPPGLALVDDKRTGGPVPVSSVALDDMLPPY